MGSHGDVPWDFPIFDCYDPLILQGSKESFPTMVSQLSNLQDVPGLGQDLRIVHEVDIIYDIMMVMVYIYVYII